MFFPSRDNDLLQFVREDEIQSDILPDVFLFSSERDIKNYDKSPLLNDLVISYIAVIIADGQCPTISFVLIAFWSALCMRENFWTLFAVWVKAIYGLYTCNHYNVLPFYN